MKYLGQDIPKLGFGCMRLPQKDGTIDIEQVELMVDEFIKAGGTYFDTARTYGESESAVRRALVERYPRESFQLATKNAAWLGAKNAEEARAFFETSLEQTGAGYFDFYLLHNLGDKRTQVFDDYDMWAFVRELKEQGKVRHIGFSMHDNADVLEEIATAHAEAEFVQLQVNYADWENGSVQSRACCEVARKHGLPIIIMEPVRGGTLANPPEPVAKILREANPDASYVSWALRFALGIEGTITVLSGMSSIEQMHDNLKIWKNYKPLGSDELAALDRAQNMLADITAVPCTSCHYCMKECPQDIDIANIMQALNRRALYGDADGRKWYSFLSGGKASACIGCGQCEDACPQHISIIENLEEAARAFESREPTIDAGGQHE
jgi:predicted aldo/keto reductase-like oxidoreductase